MSKDKQNLYFQEVEAEKEILILPHQQDKLQTSHKEEKKELKRK